MAGILTLLLASIIKAAGQTQDLPFHVLSHYVQGVTGPHITDWVAALVGRPVHGVGRTRFTLAVGKSGVGLQSVAEEEDTTSAESPRSDRLLLRQKTKCSLSAERHSVFL